VAHCGVTQLPPSVAFKSAWLVRTAAEAADAEMPGPEEYATKVLDIDELDALVLVSMVLDKVPDAMESDAGLQV
jgi:hypothetical protein